MAVLPLTALAPTVLIDIVVDSDLLENFTNEDRSSKGGRAGKVDDLCYARLTSSLNPGYLMTALKDLRSCTYTLH